MYFVVIDDMDGFDDVSLPFETFQLAAAEAQRRVREYDLSATVLEVREVAVARGRTVESLDPAYPRLDPLDLAEAPAPGTWALVDGVWRPVEKEGEEELPRYTVPLDELPDLATQLPRHLWPAPYHLPFMDQDGDVYDLDVLGKHLGRYYDDGSLCEDQATYGVDVLGLAGALAARGLL